MNTWRAGCGENRTSGSEGGPGRPTRRKARRAPRSDPYTWLPGPARGLFFYLYLILDLYSRKIVAWEVHGTEASDLAAKLVHQACLAEGIATRPLVLHADNGSPMKGATLLETLYALGITPSYSRPRVSNDNAFPESLFRTCKSARIIRWVGSRPSTRRAPGY